MSVTVFMKESGPIVIGHAVQWNFTRGTLELGDCNGDNVASFLAEDVTGCALNGAAQPETGGAYRDKTGDHFGLGAPDDDDADE